MKMYSVKEIADVLNTNPETVRRWIRDGKLKAIINSKKDGNVVYESELSKFLDSAPKYARIARQSAIVSPIIGLSAIALGVAGGIVAGQIDNKKMKTAQISPTEMVRYIRNEIEIHKTIIKKKQKEIEVLHEDIKAEEKQIEQLNLLIK